MVLALVSTVFLLTVMSEYFETGLVERFPTLIVCCFCVHCGDAVLLCRLDALHDETEKICRIMR